MSVAGTVLAQDAPPSAGVSEEETTRFDDVIVTATKRKQPVREIAGTVNVLDGEDLEKIGARELKDFIALVPGITIQEGVLDSFRKFTIRGIGPGDRTNQTVGQLIGDVPLSDPFTVYIVPDLDPFDLRTVEVLKGPQGTVFGGSALNGAIRYVPNTPKLDEWQGRAFADYVSVNQGGQAPSFGAVLNAPVGEEFALRFSGVLQQAPGVYDNKARGVKDSDSKDKWSGRALARWEATDRLSVNAFYLRQESVLHDLSRADNREGRLESNNRPGPSTIPIQFDLANLELRYAFDSATLISQSSRLTKSNDVDIDASDAVQQTGEQGIQSLRVATHPRIESYVQELRLVSQEGGRWNWITGIFLQDYKANTGIETYVTNTRPLGPVLEPLPRGLGSANGISVARGHLRPLAAKEQALFGELTRRFSERWEVTAGARLYRTRIDAEVEITGAASLASNPLSPVNGQFHQREQGVNPKLALAFKATPDVLVYAVAARGFQFGGINFMPPTDPRDSIPPSYKSSTLWSYEAGLRSDWLDRSLRLDLTAFYLNWTNAQITQTTSSDISTTDYIDNVGAVHSKGVEATFAWLTPITGLSLNSAASYLIARTAEPYNNNGTTLPAGTEMPAAPRLQTATTLAYNRMFGSLIAGAALVHTYTGKAFSNIAHEHEIYDYHVLNLNLNIGLPQIRYAPALTLGITNLLDQRGLLGRTGGSLNPVGGNGVFSYYNRPRALSLRLTAEF